MFDFPTLLSDLAAALLLVVAPGPGQMLVLARTLAGGRTALGLGIGYLVHTLAAAFGLSQLLARSAGLYAVVQYLGAAYRVFLGVKAFRARAEVPTSTPDAAEPGFLGAVARSAITGILNRRLHSSFSRSCRNSSGPGEATSCFNSPCSGFSSPSSPSSETRRWRWRRAASRGRFGATRHGRRGGSARWGCPRRAGVAPRLQPAPSQQAAGRSPLAPGRPGIHRRRGLYQEHMRLAVRDGAVLDAFRDNVELPRTELDGAVPKLDAQLSREHEEELVRLGVRMPNEGSVYLYQRGSQCSAMPANAASRLTFLLISRALLGQGRAVDSAPLPVGRMGGTLSQRPAGGPVGVCLDSAGRADEKKKPE